MFLEIVVQIVERLHVGVHALFLGIRHEHHAIHAAQDQLAAGVIEHLPGNRIKMKARLEAAHRPQIQRQKIEKQGAVGLRRQRDHLAFGFVVGLVEHVLQIGGLAAKAGAVIHDLAIDFAGGEIYEAHNLELWSLSALRNRQAPQQAARSVSSPAGQQNCKGKMAYVLIPHARRARHRRCPRRLVNTCAS